MSRANLTRIGSMRCPQLPQHAPLAHKEGDAVVVESAGTQSGCPLWNILTS